MTHKLIRFSRKRTSEPTRTEKSPGLAPAPGPGETGWTQGFPGEQGESCTHFCALPPPTPGEGRGGTGGWVSSASYVEVLCPGSPFLCVPAFLLSIGSICALE